MEFERIDDFSHYVRPDRGTVIGRTFEYLVDRHFDYVEKKDGSLLKGPNDLIMAFLEIVSLVENDVIGETLLRSEFRKQKVKLFIDEYKTIVDEVKRADSELGALPSYRNWYNMGTFILMGTNPEAGQPAYGIESSWDGQPPELVKSMGGSRQKDYREMKNAPISEEQVKDYLTCYYQKLENRLNFKNYPNVCVIVKPICVSNGEDFTPLGNLYLHFATRTPKSKNFYLRLINDFMRAWYIEHGYDIIDEIIGFSVSDAIEQKEAGKSHLPNFTVHKKKRLGQKISSDGATLKSYYDALYLNSRQRRLFEAQRERTTKKVIGHFINIDRFGRREESDASDFTEIRKLITLTPSSSLVKGRNLDLFCEILIYREVFKIGVLLFEYDLKEMYVILHDLVNKQMEHREYQVSQGTLVTALWTEHFIPCPGKEYNPRKIVNDIKNCLSKVEMEYLAQYSKWKMEMEFSDS